MFLDNKIQPHNYGTNFPYVSLSSSMLLIQIPTGFFFLSSGANSKIDMTFRTYKQLGEISKEKKIVWGVRLSKTLKYLKATIKTMQY